MRYMHVYDRRTRKRAEVADETNQVANFPPGAEQELHHVTAVSRPLLLL